MKWPAIFKAPFILVSLRRFLSSKGSQWEAADIVVKELSCYRQPGDKLLPLFKVLFLSCCTMMLHHHLFLDFCTKFLTDPPPFTLFLYDLFSTLQLERSFKILKQILVLFKTFQGCLFHLESNSKSLHWPKRRPLPLWPHLLYPHLHSLRQTSAFLLF